ncbi:MAG TPA: ABC transporter substrate-binding protein [Dehalococcoidia bacterium]|jgi:ABC-type transport system substrate-binding protein|nr:ABC transporter substrate-binding protein [Dehalococcoidia bacterium]
MAGSRASSYLASAARASLSRRRLLGGAAAFSAAAAGLTLVDCSSSNTNKGNAAVPANNSAPARGAVQTATPQSSPAAAKPVPGGTYQDYTTTDITSQDPIAATANIDRGEALWVYDRLFTYKVGVGQPATGQVDSNVFSSWELNPQSLQITMKIRQGVKWDPRAPTNSRQIDAQDIKYSFDKFHAQSVYRKDWFQDLNPASPFTSVETPDNQTVVLKTAFPLGAVFDYLGNTLGMYVMPREADGGFDPAHDARGSTPWIRDSYKPSQGFTYKRNPNWYKQGQPYFDGWERPIVPEYATALAQFRAGNIWGNVARQEDILSVKKDFPQMTLWQTDYGPTAPGVFFGWENQAVMDVRVRQAMSQLIDRQSFAQAFSNQDQFKAAGIDLGIVYDNFLGRGWGDYWLDPYSPEMGDAAQNFKFDIANAKKLLAAAGHPNGFSITFYGPTGAPYGTDYQRWIDTLSGMWAQAGIQVTQKQVDYSGDYVPNYNYNQAFDGISIFTNTTYGGVANNLRTNYHSASVQDRTPYAPAAINKPAGPKDTQLDGLIQSLLQESDLQKAIAITHNIEKYLGGVLYTIPFSYKARGLALYQPWVGDVTLYHPWVGASVPAVDYYPLWWFDASKKKS